MKKKKKKKKKDGTVRWIDNWLTEKRRQDGYPTIIYFYRGPAELFSGLESK